MTARKALLWTVLLLLLPAVTLSAFDWGVVLDNNSTLTFTEGEDADNDQRNKVSLWGEHFWADAADTQYTLTFNGYFLYDYTSEPEDEIIAVNPDLIRLKVKKAGLFDDKAVLDASIGRFRFSDPSALVLSHTADGASAQIDYGSVIVKAAAGYTGLQLKPEASVNMSAADAADDADDDVYFAPKRIFEQAEIVLPALIERQRFTLSGLLQQDLRDEGDKLDSLHIVGAANGELTKGLYYNATGAVAMNLSDDLSGFMAAGSLYYFSEELYYSRVSGGVLYADEDFFSVSPPTLGLVYAPAIADLTRISFDYSLRPWGDRVTPGLANLQFAAGGKIFMPAGEYAGTELEGGVKIKPTSDFGASVKGGVYLPDGGDTAGLLRLEFSIGL